MDVLAQVFWLKWKLMLRGYQRSTASLVGAIIMLAIFAPMAVGIAIATGFGYRLLSAPFDSYLLRAVLCMVYGFWVLSPIIGFTLNDSYDISKLFLFPISPRQIFVGTILGSFIDLPVLLALPIFAAALIGFAHSVALLLLTAVALFLFLFHTLAISQAIILMCAGALRSRRWRDIMAIVGPILALGWYLLTQVVPRYAVHADWHVLLENPAWHVANFFPPGFAALAVGAALHGAWGTAGLLLLLLAVVTVGAVFLAGRLVTLVSIGDVSSSSPRKTARAREAGTSSRPRVFSTQWLPPVIAAIVDKELKYMVCDPLFKTSLMRALYLFVVLVFAFVLPHSSTNSLQVGPVRQWAMTALLLTTGTTLFFNSFGTEGNAAATLFLFPSLRRQIIIGKNLVLYLGSTAVNIVLVLLLSVITHSLALFPLRCFLIASANVVFVAVGNLVSIWMPYRMVMRGARMQQQSAGKGCGIGLMQMAAIMVGFLLSLPVAAAIIVPMYWASPLWFILTIPLAVCYLVFLYLLSLHLAEPLLLQRENEIIGSLSAEDA